MAELERDSSEDPGHALDHARQLLHTMADGRIKLFLTWKTLRLRKQFDELFRDGEYRPLRVVGVRSKHLCAFARCTRESVIVVIAPRLFQSLMGPENRDPIGADVWAETDIELPAPQSATGWTNVFTGETIRQEREVTRFAVAELLAHFPYALLAPSQVPAGS